MWYRPIREIIAVAESAEPPEGSCRTAPRSRYYTSVVRALSRRTVLLAVLTLPALGCAGKVRPEPPSPPAAQAPVPPAPAAPPVAAPAPAPPPAPREVFESPGFVVALARAGDTPEALAARHLGSADRAWMIEDWMGTRTFSAGQVVVVPREEWNPPGVSAAGYQLVPVLVYHNIAPERRGGRNDLTIAASTFEAQMRYLKAEGYRTVRLRDLVDFTAQRRQLPSRSVMLAFDDNHRGFLRYAYPLLRELGFTATLFVPTDQVGSTTGSAFLTWDELGELLRGGFDVQAHSKTHANLRRRSGESAAEHGRRMDSELGLPQALFQRHLAQRSLTVAYPYGDVDDAVVRHAERHGYVAGFTVLRQANPAFTPPFRLHRSQVYAEWTLADFVKNLNTFHREDLRALPRGAAPAADKQEALSPARLELSPAGPGELVAQLCERVRALEHAGDLRRALDESRVALTVDPQSECAEQARRRLEGAIDRALTEGLREAQALQARGDRPEARQHFIKALALEPRNPAAFKALQVWRPAAAPAAAAPAIEGRFIAHRVRPGETLEFLAELYYGDRSRGELLAQVNGLSPARPLVPGRDLKIPEIPGVPMLRPDRQ
jgi:peptidoglycan/xylan/chitin deacetylase (PgdA/CDA1 family)/nucleoid-associated protein YgaU